MNNLGVSSVFSGIAAAYPRVAGAAAAASASGPAATAATATSPIAQEVVPGAGQSGALPTNAASPSDESAADSQAEQQAQIQRQLSQVEAELLRVRQTEIRELASRDREVRTHEQAHKAVGGQYAGAVSYSYERGPDGRLYAVGGSVAIDTAPVPGDPAATLQKLQQVQRAALAPAQPSAQDIAVAAQAAQAMAQARAELATETVDASTGEDDAATVIRDRTAATADADKSLAVYRQVSAADSPAGGSASPSVQTWA
ncbi:putative metalloprotease CJM1_0395 family protein [Halopseudomonas pelagia]|uniref:putative metalloprotease CJM1_0395 family protein n=1 Tax=Halopseudomonas pelagia TaxID=553151 RepID=UPI0030DCD895